MPPTECPSCQSLTFRLLDGPTQDAVVKYYRCDACGHVWTTRKGDSDQITHVTDLPAEDPKTDEL